MTMKSVLMICALFINGCGYSSKHNELTGQVKKLTHQTPLICSERVDADISLGVMRNGVGSMSAQDVWFTVPREEDQKILQKAAETGALVKVEYDLARLRFCWNEHEVTHAEIVE